MPKTSANTLTRQILRTLFAYGAFCWRQNSAGTPDMKKGILRPAQKVGVPDICSILPPNGRFLGIEVKIGNDRMRPEQVGFEKTVARVGGVYFTVSSFEEFMDKFTELVTVKVK